MAELLSSVVSSWMDTILIVVLAVIAILVFFGIGYLIARVINMVIHRFFESIRLEEFIKERNLSGALFGFTVTQIVTVYVKLYVVLASLGLGINLAEALAQQYLGLGIPFITENVITPFLAYLPSLAQGVIIVVVALFAAKYLANTIKASKMLMGRQLAVAVQILITYIALVLSLDLVLPNVDTTIFLKLLEYLLMALIFAFGLGTGLAFGLGLKEPIAKAASKNQKLFDDLIGRLGRK